MKISTSFIVVQILVGVLSEAFASSASNQALGIGEEIESMTSVLDLSQQEIFKGKPDAIFVPNELRNEFEQLMVEPLNHDLGNTVSHSERHLYGYGGYGYGGFRRRFCMLKVGGGHFYRMLDVDESKIQLMNKDDVKSINNDSFGSEQTAGNHRSMSGRYCYRLDKYVCCSPGYGAYGYGYGIH